MPLSTKLSPEERRAKQREYSRRSYGKHRDKNLERSKRWNTLNREKKRAANAKLVKDNPDKVRECRRKARRRQMEEKPELVRAWARASVAKWRAADPERARELQRAWRMANRASLNAQLAHARARRKRARPKWLTKAQKAEIKAMYVEARRRGHHVDHIVPLNGRSACGLHVPWNLQLLTPHENRRKYNNFDPRQAPPADRTIHSYPGSAAQSV